MLIFWGLLIINVIALKIGWNKQFRIKIVPLTEFYIFYKVSMVVAGFVFYILVVHRLCMKGTSAKLRRKILVRHTIWYIFFLYISIINAIIILNEKYSWGIFPFITLGDEKRWTNNWSDLLRYESLIPIFYYYSGIMLALIRL